MMKVAVFMGGSSSEREVSLSSGKAVADALKTVGHEVTSYDVGWRGTGSLFEAVSECGNNGTDVVFLALHGDLGENGGVQGVLEAAGLCYTGSGIGASAIAMNKDISKQLFVKNGIPTAAWEMIDADDFDSNDIINTCGLPLIIKPADQGSTVGLTFVESVDDLEDAVALAAQYSDAIMAEAFIPGSELTVPILGDEILPVIQIKPSHAIYDYECKYSAGMSDYLVPAPISSELENDLKAQALNVFTALGLRDYARVDFRLDADGQPLCFEANTLPGMTATSLVPKSARAAGIEFPNLVSRIVMLAHDGRCCR